MLQEGLIRYMSDKRLLREGHIVDEKYFPNSLWCFPKLPIDVFKDTTRKKFTYHKKTA